ncbi:uncharacterized protein LOC123535128 [Mercenaria mercenaria]|uniref:uncharacterized protein LOC123535128 n=1 Tax=Mercenaria mercenaria TaxID=6596 RepID=UPI00234F1964|nr:uncharacterized protein LOC123535128 [Mercenaria mercenaria]
MEPLRCFFDVIKQVPLLFVLMLSRRKDDYIAVLQKTKELLRDPSVEVFVVDFEAAVWGAIRDVFPNVQIKGCVFHWSQSVFRHVESIGLGPAYMERGSIWNYVRQLLVLPFLPVNHIKPEFDQLAARANTDALRQLVDYIRSTWIESTVFTVENWSIFMHRVRTNNNVEGWHNRLNGDCGQRALSFYKFQELVDHGVGRQQRPETRRSDAKLLEYWEDYSGKKDIRYIFAEKNYQSIRSCGVCSLNIKKNYSDDYIRTGFTVIMCINDSGDIC